jgi:hypothetical protein
MTRHQVAAREACRSGMADDLPADACIRAPAL